MASARSPVVRAGAHCVFRVWGLALPLAAPRQVAELPRVREAPRATEQLWGRGRGASTVLGKRPHPLPLLAVLPVI